ncbi:hypothetical protein ACFL0Z_02285 [Patescibacteria group bacterium]
MIRVECHRLNGLSHIDERSVMDAFHLFVAHELDFGGQVTYLDPNRIEVETVFLDCHDTTVFSGAVEEMSTIVQLASLVACVQSDENLIVNCAADSLEITVGQARLLALTSSAVYGRQTLRAAITLSLGIEIDAAVINNICLSDLVAAISLSEEMNLTLQEVLDEI